METHLKRWVVLLGYWAAQAVVLVVGGTLFYGSTAGGRWELLPPADYIEFLGEHDIRVLLSIWLPLLTGLQCLLVLPVQLRPAARGRGKSVWVALAAAGALIALVTVGFGAALSEMVVLYDFLGPRGWSWPLLLGSLAASWAVFTTLLVRYSRRSTLGNEDLLTRVARIVFAGTIVETAALIPIDVLIRRKTDCYCWAGSLVALVLGGAVGIVVAGPAVFLPLLARRPLWLRAGRCGGCGYDRAGLPAAAACPECGAAVPGDEPER